MLRSPKMPKGFKSKHKTIIDGHHTLTDVLPKGVSYSSRGLALRWRMAIYTSLAIAILSIAGAFIAYVVIRNSLYNNLIESLENDALKIKDIYEGKVQSQPFFTGGIVVQIYNQRGEFIRSSQETFEANVPSQEIVMALDSDLRLWQGVLNNLSVTAMLTPITNFGVVAVLRTTGYISAVLKRLAQSLIVTVAILTIISSIVGYFVAATSLRPVTELASTAAKLDPNDLVTLPYRGPNDEIGQLHTVLDALIERLKAAMDAQKVFLAETSHELRTPLTSIKGFLERAQKKEPVHSEVRVYIDDAVRISQSMTRLVSDILQLSRGEYVREYRPFLLDVVKDLLKPAIQEFPGVGLAANCNKEVLILGDSDRLRQMMRNLVSNAIGACGSTDKVMLSFLEVSEYVVIQVKDRGPGIRPESLPHIFNKFYKGGKGGGFGLGLAIVKQIVETHKGRIEVESEFGKGTIFSIYLPALDSEA